MESDQTRIPCACRPALGHRSLPEPSAAPPAFDQPRTPCSGSPRPSQTTERPQPDTPATHRSAIASPPARRPGGERRNRAEHREDILRSSSRRTLRRVESQRFGERRESRYACAIAKRRGSVLDTIYYVLTPFTPLFTLRPSSRTRLALMKCRSPPSGAVSGAMIPSEKWV